MTLEEALKLAAAAAKKKDALGTVHALEDALVVARVDAPLEIRAACPINHDHTGIGLYTPAARDVVDGRRVRVYVEVANFALTSLDAGKTVWHAQLDVTGDFSFEDATADAGIAKLQSGVGLGTQAFDTRALLGVTSFGVEIGLGAKSPAGTYHVALHVHDVIGKKTASRDVRFVLT